MHYRFLYVLPIISCTTYDIYNFYSSEYEHLENLHITHVHKIYAQEMEKFMVEVRG